jgi:hypothetical protein
MRITVFTSNQPRHVALIESLAGVADVVFAIQECNTVFPGRVDDFFRKSDVMRDYFSRVIAAEREVFGGPRFGSANAFQLPIKMGDLNRIDLDSLKPALESDVYVVFGASFIKGPLCDFLVKRGALNIHMGVSPYYRGSSTNFWALYDRRPDYVGATIHLLSRGLDSGPMLFHVFPPTEAVDPFVLGMKAVKAAHATLVESIRTGVISGIRPTPQDKSREIRYTRNSDFTDEVAREYLDRLPTPDEVHAALAARNTSAFLLPQIAHGAAMSR